MSRQVLIAGIAAGVTAVAGLARASPVVDAKPDLIVAGGYDDNLLFNNQGGDRIGQLGLRLKLHAEDHLWHLSLDVGGSAYGFQIHNQLYPIGEGKGRFVAHLSHADALRLRFQAEGSDNPMALAQLGLLGAGGTALGFKSLVQWEHRFANPRWSLINGVEVNGERRLDPQFAADSGDVAGLSVKPRYYLTRALALETTVEARTFFSTSIVGNSAEVLPGVYYRIARRLHVEAQVGGGEYFDNTGNVPIWIARGLMTWQGRAGSVDLAIGHDLAIPTTRAGVIEGELLEGGWEYTLKQWQFGARAGFYRTQSSPRSAAWQPAYGLQGGAFYKAAKYLWIGATALHFEQLPTSIEPSVTRDAIFLRADFTAGTPL